MKAHLADIIIQNIEFFGLASDLQVHPDAAVRQLEIVSALLKELSRADLDEFMARVEMRLQKLKKDGASQEQLDFLQNIREHLGLDP